MRGRRRSLSRDIVRGEYPVKAGLILGHEPVGVIEELGPGGTLSSLGVYAGKLVAPYEAFNAGLGDKKIVTTLCPGGKERMRRLMAMVEHRRVDLSPLITHRFALDDIEQAFELFSHQRDGVLKVALYPDAARMRSAKSASGDARR